MALAKIANTFLTAGIPTIVGMSEVENIGILDDLAAWDSLAVYDSQPVLVEGNDSRGIDVDYLVRGDHVEIPDVQQHIAPEGLTSRPPLLVKVEIGTSRGDITHYALNNHFSSLAGGDAATKPRRTAQAAWNLTVAEQILVTPNLMVLLEQVVILHVNSNYSLPDPDDPSPFRKSDHDPLIVIFTLSP